jgi:peptide-methionine (R)-S-oxide reductase
MDRRSVLKKFAVGIGVIFATPFFPKNSSANEKERFEVVHTEAEWKSRLTSEEFRVLRKEGTERSGSSSLNREKRSGMYNCAGCKLPLFASQSKYESGTGWPSFFEPLSNAVVTRNDSSLFLTRIEVHCRRCGGHLGHVFDDGPIPSGKRYCMNGIALNFSPDK